MAEFTLPPGFGAAHPLPRPAAGRPDYVVAPVARASGSPGAEARMDTPQFQVPPTVRRPMGGADEAGAPRPLPDDPALVGPSPAFQANVLELERDLRRVIERLEESRARPEAEVAVRPAGAAVALEKAVPRGDTAAPAGVPDAAVDAGADARAPDAALPASPTTDEAILPGA